MEPRSEDQKINLSTVYVSSSAISLISSTLLCLFYIYKGRANGIFMNRFVFVLSFLDIFCILEPLVVTSYYLVNHEHISQVSTKFCIFLAWFFIFCQEINFGISLLISFYLYCSSNWTGAREFIERCEFKIYALFAVFGVVIFFWFSF